MHLWSDVLTDDDIYDVATELGVCIADRGTVFNGRPPIPKRGRARFFGLRPESGMRDEHGNHRYQRTSASSFHEGRRVHAVCWHGHRDFMREIFNRDPNARIKTMWEDYRGQDAFEDRHVETAYRNVGSIMYPRYANEVCTCGAFA